MRSELSKCLGDAFDLVERLFRQPDAPGSVTEAMDRPQNFANPSCHENADGQVDPRRKQNDRHTAVRCMNPERFSPKRRELTLGRSEASHDFGLVEYIQTYKDRKRHEEQGGDPKQKAEADPADDGDGGNPGAVS